MKRNNRPSPEYILAYTLEHLGKSFEPKKIREKYKTDPKTKEPVKIKIEVRKRIPDIARELRIRKEDVFRVYKEYRINKEKEIMRRFSASSLWINTYVDEFKDFPYFNRDSWAMYFRSIFEEITATTPEKKNLIKSIRKLW